MEEALAPVRKALKEGTNAAYTAHDQAEKAARKARREAQRADVSACTALDQARALFRDAENEARAAAATVRNRIFAETEDKIIAIYAAGRDVSDYDREIVLKMALAERRLCSF